MSLIQTIKGWFGARPSASRPGAAKLYIVDGVAILNPRGGGRVSPRDMIALLHRLGRFVEREKVEIQTVFEGEPLRRAGDGDEFSGVTVYYAVDGRSLQGEILNLVRKGLKGRRHVTAIVQDVGLEKQAQAAGAHVLRCSTFRKVLDGGGDEGHRPGGGGGGGGPRRRPDRRPPQDRRPPDQRSPDQRPPDQRPPSGGNGGGGRQGGDAIRDLIDVVE